MIAKKKGLYLGLLLSMLGVGSAMQAYRVQIRNSTPFVVKFTLKFHAETPGSCRRDVQELAPGHMAEIQSSLCTVKSLEADVFQKRHAGTMLEVTSGTVLGEKVVEANKYKSPTGRAGNTIFIINGPYLSRNYKEGVFYQVDRSSTKFGQYKS